MEEQRTTFKIGRSIGLTLPKEWCEQNGITTKSQILIIFANGHEESEPTSTPIIVETPQKTSEKADVDIDYMTLLP